MAPQTRRGSFPRVIIERDTDSEESSSEEEEEEDAGANGEEEEAESEGENAEKAEEAMVDKKKGKAPISISLKKVCKVSLFCVFLKVIFSGFSAMILIASLSFDSFLPSLQVWSSLYVRSARSLATRPDLRELPTLIAQ